MKKAVALLLGLMLVLGFALVACGEEETTTTAATTATTAAPDTTEATETTEAAATTAVDWTEAGDYEGQVATITGVVGGINDLWTEKSVAKICIVLGDPEGDHFNAAISLNADGTFPEYMAAYADMLDMLVGATVEVTGTVVVNSWESCFEINLTDADGDNAPDAEPAGTFEVISMGEASAAVDWTEAGDYEGEVATISGVVGGINDLWTEKSVAKICIVLGDPEGDHFNAAISLNADGTFPAYMAQYEGTLDALVGQTVEVTGTVVVNSWESCFEINLTDADGDNAPDAEAAGTLAIM